MLGANLTHQTDDAQSNRRAARRGCGYALLLLWVGRKAAWVHRLW